MAAQLLLLALVVLVGAGVKATPVPATPTAASVSAAPAPDELMVNFQPSPSVGIPSSPVLLTWAVPPACPSASDQRQVAYQVVVKDVLGSTAWDSGKTASNQSVSVPYRGPQLSPGTVYKWNVTVWTEAAGMRGSECQSAPSATATFISSLFQGFSASASWITAPSAGIFNLLRNTIHAPPANQIVSAVAFVSAQVGSPLMLAGYKLFVDDVLVSVGAGRDEGSAWGGPGKAVPPYVTVDVTPHLTGPSRLSDGTVLLALQTMSFGVPAALLQLDVVTRDGTKTSFVTNNSSQWRSFNADKWFNPTKPSGEHSAGNAHMEYTDQRQAEKGWRTAAFDDSHWSPAVAASGPDLATLTPRMAGAAVEILDDLKTPTRVALVPPPPPPTPSHPVPCGETPENGPPLLLGGCASGHTISDVEFAYWGTPSGDCQHGFVADPSCNANNTKQIVASKCVGKPSCTLSPSRNTFGDPCYDVVKRLAVGIKCSGPVPPPAPPPPVSPQSTFFVDFGIEFQGGLVLSVPAAVSGEKVQIVTAELCKGQPCTDVEQTWGWNLTWTLESNAALPIEQHQYMLFRYATVTFFRPGVTVSDFDLKAWVVQAPYNAGDSSFSSSNATLNHVWELCRYTLQASILDTYTDSNTRERRPYEADGMIAAGARLLLTKSAVMWARHSHTWVFNYPTWPIQWLQITPLLALQDYMATGQTFLFESFVDLLYSNTQIGELDPDTGLIKLVHKRQIIGWDPFPGSDMWKNSDYTSVANFYAARGLQVLAGLATVSGRSANATKFAAAASALQAAVVKHMWNTSTQRFCDGICSDPLIQGHSGIYSDMYALLLDLVPQASVANVWKHTADWGLERIGDYGAFIYLHALNKYAGDDGTTLLNQLTKCDQFSWCYQWLNFNATMTREGWTMGTMSHAWGTAAIPAIVNGLMGVNPTAPAWATFTVKPRLGSLESASIRVPTPRGPIETNATAFGRRVETAVPCGSFATLCVAHSDGPGTVYFDGVPVAPDHLLWTKDAGRHACVQHVGCGPTKGTPRVLEWV